MGGSGGGSTAPVQDNSAQLAMISEMRRESEAAAAAARKAQEDAVYNSQVQAANQAGTQGSQQAMQQLGLLNQTQQAADAATLASQQNAATGLAESATGGTYDINASRKAQLANLGSAAGFLPKTKANQFATDPMGINPANKTAGSVSANQFKVPATEGLKFGGM
jgi:tRNA A37 threonylcarbamoyladenosine modification protein TsaB